MVNWKLPCESRQGNDKPIGLLTGCLVIEQIEETFFASAQKVSFHVLWDPECRLRRSPYRSLPKLRIFALFAEDRHPPATDVRQFTPVVRFTNWRDLFSFGSEGHFSCALGSGVSPLQGSWSSLWSSMLSKLPFLWNLWLSLSHRFYLNCRSYGTQGVDKVQTRIWMER